MEALVRKLRPSTIIRATIASVVLLKQVIWVIIVKLVWMHVKMWFVKMEVLVMHSDENEGKSGRFESMKLGVLTHFGVVDRWLEPSIYKYTFVRTLKLVPNNLN